MHLRECGVFIRASCCPSPLLYTAFFSFFLLLTSQGGEKKKGEVEEMKWERAGEMAADNKEVVMTLLLYHCLFMLALYNRFYHRLYLYNEILIAIILIK